MTAGLFAGELDGIAVDGSGDLWVLDGGQEGLHVHV